MALVGALQQSLHDLAMNVALWTVLVLAIPLVAARTIDGVYLAFLALIILAAFEAVQPLGPAFAALGRSVAAGERVLAVAAVAPSVVEPPVVPPAPQAESGATSASTKSARSEIRRGIRRTPAAMERNSERSMMG